MVTIADIRHTYYEALEWEQRYQENCRLQGRVFLPGALHTYFKIQLIIEKDDHSIEDLNQIIAAVNEMSNEPFYNGLVVSNFVGFLLGWVYQQPYNLEKANWQGPIFA